MAATASAITVYNRTAAVAYANANWNKVVNDGYFYIDSYPATYIGAGQPVPAGGNDCAHFVSSVLGTPGGGLTIPNRAGTYGEPGAARLDELLVGNSAGGYGTTYKYGVLVSSVSQLTPGDVIGYDWDGSGNGSMGGIDHTVVYIGNGLVNCHSNSRLGANWTLGGADNYFFVHITLPDSIVPTAPNNVSPASNTSVSNTTPTLTASAFSDGAPGSTQVAAQWLIYKGLSLVYDTGTDASHFTSMSVPSGKLSVGTTYTWQVRYQDNYGDWSNYSTPSSLTTMLLGDYNKNGVVDTADYLIWRTNQGRSNALANDAIGGVIGQAQFNQWRAHYGQTAGSGSGTLGSGEVPEPATCSLMILAAVSMWTRQRRSRALSLPYFVGSGKL